METPLNQPKSNTTLLVVIIVGILLIGASFYLGVNYGKNQETNKNINTNQSTATQNTNTSNLNSNANTNTNESIVSELCEVGKEFKNEATNPVTCKCPTGYEFETVRMEFGSCPREGMRDCLASVVKCVEDDGIKLF